jgi:hypothetical protein
MRLGKANFAGLASARQQSEMNCILSGSWPPLKPLPVFKYETVEYRATIDFDKLRGEWVCRKTSFPSNTVQELRGGLREITIALPHGETEPLLESPEQAEQEQEQDKHRRLQSIHDWRENFESGKHYFVLRNYLSESQRAEIDDSLRMSLTARQLQFNSKNIALVFDALSTAGGRFATLIEFAKRSMAKPETFSMEAGGATPEVEHEIDNHNPSLEASAPKFGQVHTSDIPFIQNREYEEAEELNAHASEVPAISIKSVWLEQVPPSLTEWTSRTEPKPFDFETSQALDADSVSLVEEPDQEGHAAPLQDFAAEIRMDEPSDDRSRDSSPRLPALEISVSRVAFVFLFLFAVAVLSVGLIMGFGPLSGRLMEASKSMLNFSTTSPTESGQTHESTSPASLPPVTSSDKSPGTNKLGSIATSEDESRETVGGSIPLEESPATDTHSSRIVEAKPYAESEVRSDRTGAGGLIVRNEPPTSIYKAPPSGKAPSPTSSAPDRPAPNNLASAAAPHSAKPTAILVNIPAPANEAFRVSFPEKAIAATSSFAMMSQLSVLVSPQPRSPFVHRPARLEAGELVSFVWPRFPRAGDRFGTANLIKVRVTIGQFGQVRKVDFLSGSPSFLTATTRAIYKWHYSPTLLDKKPVQVQQDVTIEFRPGRILGAGVNPASTPRLAPVE